MDIVIIAQFTQAPDQKGNGRFHYIAAALSDGGDDVEVITSRFSHDSKSHRNFSGSEPGTLKYRFTMLDEPGYRKNVSLKRFYSHHRLAGELEKYLRGRRRPDVIYCAVPSAAVANVAGRYAKKNRIRFIIDIQDLWPEAFEMVFHVPVLSRLLFLPFKIQADRVYKKADMIVAVSKTYAERAKSVNQKSAAAVVFLGTELGAFDKMASANLPGDKPPDEIWIGYTGTLGHSYDLTLVIKALGDVKTPEGRRVRLVVMGDGPMCGALKDCARENGVPCTFTGRLPYEKMAGLLSACDIAVNPIRKKASQSIINKHADYAAAGLPVVSTQDSREYRELLDAYNAGITCMDAGRLREAIETLCRDAALRSVMGAGSRKMAVELFDRVQTYKIIYDIIRNNTDDRQAGIER